MSNNRKLTFIEAVDEIIQTMNKSKEVYPEMNEIDLEKVRKGLMDKNEELRNCLYDQKELRRFVSRKVREHVMGLRKRD